VEDNAKVENAANGKWAPYFEAIAFHLFKAGGIKLHHSF